MGFTEKQKQVNAYRVQGFLLDGINAIRVRKTHRRPEDHAQAKIDAEAKRERRRNRNKRNATIEQFAAFDRVDMMVAARDFNHGSAFDHLVAAGMVRA